MKIDIFADLMRLVERNRDGSYATRAARREVLAQVAHDLKDMGFRTLPATGLKPKHVAALVERWKASGIVVGTMKNRMSHVRWWAEKVGKQNCVPRTNAESGIGRRRYVTNISKALVLTSGDLEKIADERLRCSVELQQAFGLRREECLKFQAKYALAGLTADVVQEIHLGPTWCKGGRARAIPITDEHQRAVLARATAFCESGSMIPKDLKYVDQLHRYKSAVEKAGLSKLHGLRHAYAQRRYQQLTGWPAPAAGGPVSAELTQQQRAVDRSARLQVSGELGHNREEITAVYLGR
ncbi:integrase domain-containing protein [Cupriavidus sp. P-10]|uniref:phage integrase N-terminal domain-containing protein n=1 Tax=Cupriavidus sp. P-10 TaxID=2027911 RepID=UPI000E2F8F20|nr:phage integrase N-terminal domain-containing protein [Cupriavidus sp. P-10]BDB25150.1 integrase domain-containing protein [Cupriavidus sp. P-10]